MLVTQAFSMYITENIVLQNGSEKTAKNYRSVVNSLLRSINDIPIELLSEEHVARWKQHRDYLGHSSSTVAHDISRLRQVLKFLRRRGVNVLDPTMLDSPRVIKKPPVYLLSDEVKQIIDVIDSPRDKAIFACMFDSGARVSELLNINRADLQANTVQIVGKGSKIGTLRFGSWAMGYLNDYLGSRKDVLRPLFISAQRRRITVQRVEQLLHEYTDMAGIEKNVTPHVLRHSFATDLKLNGADIFEVKEQLRHEKISSTEIYIHIEEAEKDRVYSKYHTNLG